jgi:hypothetical protein
VISWFQAFAFKCNLYRYAPDPTLLSLAGRVHLQLGDLEGAQLWWGLYKLNSFVDP